MRSLSRHTTARATASEQSRQCVGSWNSHSLAPSLWPNCGSVSPPDPKVISSSSSTMRSGGCRPRGLPVSEASPPAPSPSLPLFSGPFSGRAGISALCLELFLEGASLAQRDGRRLRGVIEVDRAEMQVANDLAELGEGGVAPSAIGLARCSGSAGGEVSLLVPLPPLAMPLAALLGGLSWSRQRWSTC